MYGLAEGAILKFYQYVVDPAPPDSWPTKVFVRLAKGPLRYGAATKCPGAVGLLSHEQFVASIRAQWQA